jgi:hypothetical protein
MSITKEGFRLIYEVSKIESVTLKGIFKTDSGSTIPHRAEFRTSLLMQEDGEFGLTDKEYNLDVIVHCANADELKHLGELLRKVDYVKDNISFPAMIPNQDGYTTNYKVKSLIDGEEFLKHNAHIMQFTKKEEVKKA